MRSTEWSDNRLDDLNGKVDDLSRRIDNGFTGLRSEIDGRFARVDARIDRINDHLDSLQRAMVHAMVAITAAILTGFGGMFALLATQV